MHIIVRGEMQRIEELINKMGNQHEYTILTDVEKLGSLNADLIFDLNLDDEPLDIFIYEEVDVPLIISCAKVSLTDLLNDFMSEKRIYGINALSGFISAQTWEMNCLRQEDRQWWTKNMPDYRAEWVACRAGMITPRIIAMIINEACYTLQEGTANIQDIDNGMRLGTNYPKGPFEWADEIGVGHIYELLYFLYEDTRDDRFKVCPLLKEYAISNQCFYSSK
jgi:3-hydroxybutyryl-CoA dehydrogenase